MKELPLSQGKIAIVDDVDYDHLAQWKWSYTEAGYAIRRSKKSEDGGGRRIYLHRVIMRANEEEIVDHINRDRLDNRRANLRLVSPQHNCVNRGIHKRNKTGIKGVYVSPFGKYVVNISVNNRTKYLGTFDTLEEAEKCREAGCLRFHGVHYKN